jgi:hypothetical protein
MTLPSTLTPSVQTGYGLKQQLQREAFKLKLRRYAQLSKQLQTKLANLRTMKVCKPGFILPCGEMHLLHEHMVQ